MNISDFTSQQHHTISQVTKHQTCKIMKSTFFFFPTGEEVLSSDSSTMFSQYNNSYLKKSRKHDSSGYDPIKTFQRQPCVSVLIQQASRSAALQACVRKSGINMRACSCYRRKRSKPQPTESRHTLTAAHLPAQHITQSAD